jgi:hypothetical protein
LRWRREKREGGENLSSELLCVMEANMRWLIKDVTMLRMLLRKANNGHREVPHAPTNFFKYRKIITLLTPWDNSKKNEGKKPKKPLNHRQKKVDPKSYAVITVYKKYENSKISSNISCVVFFFMGTGVITLCNKYVKNTIIPLNICLFFYH